MITLLFDIDGTLISTGGAGKAAMQQSLLEEFGLDQVMADVEFAGRSDRGIVKDLFAQHDIENSHDNWSRFQLRYTRNLNDSLAACRGRVLAGVAELLERLQEHASAAIGLLTGNIRQGAQIKLEHYGLYHHFSFGGFGDDHVDRNSIARQAAASARSHLDGRFSPDRVWVIGDTPNDIQCARSIGARVAAVATGEFNYDQLQTLGPDLMLHDLADTDTMMQLVE